MLCNISSSYAMIIINFICSGSERWHPADEGGAGEHRGAHLPGASSSSHQHQRHDHEDLHHYRDSRCPTRWSNSSRWRTATGRTASATLCAPFAPLLLPQSGWFLKVIWSVRGWFVNWLLTKTTAQGEQDQHGHDCPGLDSSSQWWSAHTRCVSWSWRWWWWS